METKRNNGAIIGGSILILAGLLALLSKFEMWTSIWPLIIVGIGSLFFVGMFLGGRSVAGLAIPGSIISVTGLMLLVQNLTGYWESWSYGWTVLLLSVGLGIFIMGTFNGNQQTRRSGLHLMEVAGVLLVIFGSFFELIFSSGQPHRLGQWIAPAALILLGVYLVLARSGLIRKGSQIDSDPVQPPAKDQ